MLAEQGLRLQHQLGLAAAHVESELRLAAALRCVVRASSCSRRVAGQESASCVEPALLAKLATEPAECRSSAPVERDCCSSALERRHRPCRWQVPAWANVRDPVLQPQQPQRQQVD